MSERLQPGITRREFIEKVAILGGAATLGPTLLVACGNPPEKHPQSLIDSERMNDTERKKANEILGIRLLNEPHRFGPFGGKIYQTDNFTDERVKQEKNLVKELVKSGDVGQIMRGFWYIHTTPARKDLRNWLGEQLTQGSIPQIIDLPEDRKAWAKAHSIDPVTLGLAYARVNKTQALIGQLMSYLNTEVIPGTSPRKLMLNVGGAAAIVQAETAGLVRIGDRYVQEYWQGRLADKKATSQQKQADQNQYDNLQAYVERLNKATGLTYHLDNLGGGPTGEIGLQVMPDRLIEIDDLYKKLGAQYSFNVFDVRSYYDFICVFMAQEIDFGEGNKRWGYVIGYPQNETLALEKWNGNDTKETDYIKACTDSYQKKFIGDAVTTAR